MLRRLLLLLLLSGVLRLDAALDIRDGDRVLLLGDTLLEREGAFGLLETRLLQQFPKSDFSVRNLAFAGDTPLGWSRASFDPPARGFQRLKEQIALVRPTVAIIGYGMAASLQELTDCNGDWTQNRDPVRYGSEPMSAARFKSELGQCLDAVSSAAQGPVRFVLLSPIAHEDLRSTRPGLPDPAPHNALLAAYRQAVAELATERKAEYVDLSNLKSNKAITDNGIHLNATGQGVLAQAIGKSLGWPAPEPAPAGLREAVLRKNELFYYRWRPANETYLFGFRKGEQGRNGAEIPQFDPLIAQEEQTVRDIRQGKAPAKAAPVVTAKAPAPEASPLPAFQLADGLEISLWAENPLLSKPTEVNWDSDGRLWAASSALYPQIAPGERAADSVLILEDPARTGKATRSTVFATGLLIPTGVQPVRTASGKWACYVGQSTDLLYFEDTDGDGQADTKRVVLSGFGTEDTHHLIHTLRFGPDGRLYFNQSIYNHSHVETPHGMIRLNSGGVFAYDPRTERVEVVSRGLVNSWGHAWDARGQAFLTDGAGGKGINLQVPGAMQESYEGARKILPSISPGSYPKFCGLELVFTPLFAESWQGTALTCDFRAHKVVRFALEDLATSGKSGFVARQTEVTVQTSDASFRPIDVKLGPDGAIYLADWSNPIINHGEVDFRDARRDHTHGRIWRIAPKAAAPLPWQALSAMDDAALKKSLASASLWERSQASDLLYGRGKLMAPPPATLDALEKLSRDPSPRVRLGAMRELARTPSQRTATLILDAACNEPQGDAFYEYAAWLAVNDVSEVWVQALLSEKWPIKGQEAQLEYALNALRPETAGRILPKVVAELGVLPKGTWIELIGKAGAPDELRKLYDACPSLPEAAFLRATQALAEAARVRDTRPTGDLSGALAWLEEAALPKRLAGVRLVSGWKLAAAVPRLQALASDPDPALVRAALEGLLAMGRTDELRSLASTGTGATRIAATLELARLKLTDAVPEVFATLKAVAGATPLQPFWTELLQIKGAPQLLADKLPADLPTAATQAGLKVAQGLGKSAEPLAQKLAGTVAQPAAAGAGVDIAHLTARAKAAGDPAAGELVYRRAGSACTLCHAIGGAGGKLGPDLTSIGASAPLDYIVESVVSPALKVKEGYHAFAFTLKDGSEPVGIPSRETAQEQFIQTPVGEVSLPKSAIVGKKMAEGGASLMPAGLTAAMSEKEQLDLYAFLGQLGRPGPFDASKNNVARVWRVARSAAQDAPPLLVQALVDGRLPLALLAEKIAQAPGATGILLARFQAPASGTATFRLTGVTKAWVDDKPLALSGSPITTAAASGTHTLRVEFDPKALPEIIRADSSDATFLSEP